MDWEHVEELWDEWEIHCLVLLICLFLQVLLFLVADMRRRTVSCVLRTVVWLAYLLADTVAIFVLGHLAVNARGVTHNELIFFWAPFMLVHLGGQDTITAFSKQDNELWMRHLLSLVSQVTVAVYVVSKSSWPDGRLRAAMALIFLSGSLKYAERTCCLYLASPESLRAKSLHSLSSSLAMMDRASSLAMMDRAQTFPKFLPLGLLFAKPEVATRRRSAIRSMEASFEAMLTGKVKISLGAMWKGDTHRETIRKMGGIGNVITDIMSVDAPLNHLEVILAADDLPRMLEKFKNNPGQYYMAYQYVAAHLAHSYQQLHTKNPLRPASCWALNFCFCITSQSRYEFWTNVPILYYLISPVFQFLSSLIALVLFIAAEKEGRHSRADITVSYILLVGAIALDLVPISMCIVSCARSGQLPGWGKKKKQWSEELGQYSMIRRHTVQDTAGMSSSVQQWIGRHLGAWGVDLLDLTHTPVTNDLMELVLSKLLWFQTNKQEWGFARFRGERTLRNWMESRRVPELNKSISAGVDFPTSMLICNIATDICYFFQDDGSNKKPADDINKKKKMSRELSHYIMYLVFKCDVMLTSNSRLIHHKAHNEITEILSGGQQPPQVNLGEKAALLKVSRASKEGKQVSRTTRDSDATISIELQELLQGTTEALYSLVLPRASAVAQELKEIDEAGRWDLISDMWLEMLFYIAPRCGGAFHYEHLSTGGEFITHVLLLMRLLGPFLPLQAGDYCWGGETASPQMGAPKHRRPGSSSYKPPEGKGSKVGVDPIGEPGRTNHNEGPEQCPTPAPDWALDPPFLKGSIRPPRNVTEEKVNSPAKDPRSTLTKSVPSPSMPSSTCKGGSSVEAPAPPIHLDPHGD